jgi:hypothetical protein
MSQAKNGATSAVQGRMWEKCYDIHIKHTDALNQNVQTMYLVVLGQCTDAMGSKLEGHDRYLVVVAASDAIGLLCLVQNISFNFQSCQKYSPLGIHEAVCQFYLSKQGNHIMMQEYLELFTNNKDMVEHCGGNIGMHISLIRVVLVDEGIDVAAATLAKWETASATTQAGEIPHDSFSHEFRQEALWRPASGT